MPIFSRGEMERRLSNLRSHMAAQNLDGVVATSYPTFYYLTGAPIHAFGRPIAVVIPVNDAAAIVESIIEIDHTRAQTWIEDIRTYHDYNILAVYDSLRSPLESLVAQVRSVIASRGLSRGRIGIENARLPYQHFQLLQAAMEQVEWVDASHTLDLLRLVLSQEELALVQAADAVADVGQELLIEQLEPGRRAGDIVHTVRETMIQEICRVHPQKPFHLHVDPGLGDVRKAAGHSEWTLWNADDRVENDQLLTTVISVWLWGYWGNIERTVYVGAPDDRVRRAFDIMVEANETAIAQIHPSMHVRDIDGITKEVLGNYGYTSRSGSGCGRGIVSYEGNARELHMDLRLYSDVVLEPGMAFSLEPDLLEPGIGTFRHCNTILVTDNGCEVDSRLPRGPMYV